MQGRMASWTFLRRIFMESFILSLLNSIPHPVEDMFRERHNLASSVSKFPRSFIATILAD